ncbi:MAG: hypothetical protein LBR40_01735 [Bacilli bacterium]|jgi:hypothetical protein|nr:hypothetical protein [Bacilli bacterium]
MYLENITYLQLIDAYKIIKLINDEDSFNILNNKIITLNGDCGIGKTTVLEFVRDQRIKFYDLGNTLVLINITHFIIFNKINLVRINDFDGGFLLLDISENKDNIQLLRYNNRDEIEKFLFKDNLKKLEIDKFYNYFKIFNGSIELWNEYFEKDKLIYIYDKVLCENNYNDIETSKEKRYLIPQLVFIFSFILFMSTIINNIFSNIFNNFKALGIEIMIIVIFTLFIIIFRIYLYKRNNVFTKIIIWCSRFKIIPSILYENYMNREIFKKCDNKKINIIIIEDINQLNKNDIKKVFRFINNLNKYFCLEYLHKRLAIILTMNLSKLDNSIVDSYYKLESEIIYSRVNITQELFKIFENTKLYTDLDIKIAMLIFNKLSTNTNTMFNYNVRYLLYLKNIMDNDYYNDMMPSDIILFSSLEYYMGIHFKKLNIERTDQYGNSIYDFELEQFYDKFHDIVYSLFYNKKSDNIIHNNIFKEIFIKSKKEQGNNIINFYSSQILRNNINNSNVIQLFNRNGLTKVPILYDYSLSKIYNQNKESDNYYYIKKNIKFNGYNLIKMELDNHVDTFRNNKLDKIKDSFCIFRMLRMLYLLGVLNRLIRYNKYNSLLKISFNEEEIINGYDKILNRYWSNINDDINIINEILIMLFEINNYIKSMRYSGLYEKDNKSKKLLGFIIKLNKDYFLCISENNKNDLNEKFKILSANIIEPNINDDNMSYYVVNKEEYNAQSSYETCKEKVDDISKTFLDKLEELFSIFMFVRECESKKSRIKFTLESKNIILKIFSLLFILEVLNDYDEINKDINNNKNIYNKKIKNKANNYKFIVKIEVVSFFETINKLYMEGLFIDNNHIISIIKNYLDITNNGYFKQIGTKDIMIIFENLSNIINRKLAK